MTQLLKKHTVLGRTNTVTERVLMKMKLTNANGVHIIITIQNRLNYLERREKHHPPPPRLLTVSLK